MLAECHARPPLASLTGCLPEFNELPVASPSSHISLQRDGAARWDRCSFANSSIFVERRKQSVICSGVGPVSVRVTACTYQQRRALFTSTNG